MTTPGHRRKITTAQADELVREIKEMREGDPALSLSEVCRRLAPKYKITASAVRYYSRYVH